MTEKLNQHHDINIEQAIKLALLVTQKPETVGTCLSQQKMKLLVEKRLSKEQYNEALKHLDTCQSCFDKWVEKALEQEDKSNGAQTISHIAECDEYQDQSLRLAAAPEKKVKNGKAYGVAIDKSTNKGSIIKIDAMVGDEIKDSGSFSILGYEEKSKQTTPLEHLMGATKQLFQSESLLNFQFHKRDINIRIHTNNTDLFVKSESLILATIMSIVNAAVGRKENESYIYSSDIDLSGKLLLVGMLTEKLRYLKTIDKEYKLIISNDIYNNELGKDIIDQFNEQIICFGSLNEIFQKFDIEVPPQNKEIIENVSVKSPEKNEAGNQSHPFKTNFWKYLSVAMLSNIVFAFVMGIISTDLIYPAHVLMIRDVTYGINSSIVSLFITLFLFSGALVSLVGFRKIKQLNSKWLNKKIAVTLLCFLIAYLGVNFLIYNYQFSQNMSRFEKYLKIEHLTDIWFYQCFSSGLNNTRMDIVIELSDLKEISKLENAVRIGLLIQPDLYQYKDVFNKLSAILIRNTNNEDSATVLLCNYVGYINAIQSEKNKITAIADTVDHADRLMKKYFLSGHKCSGYRIGGFIEKLYMDIRKLRTQK